MVANIDDWLFKWADNKECEPEIKDDGSITCTGCLHTTCAFWEDFNEV